MTDPTTTCPLCGGVEDGHIGEKGCMECHLPSGCWPAVQALKDELDCCRRIYNEENEFWNKETKALRERVETAVDVAKVAWDWINDNAPYDSQAVPVLNQLVSVIDGTQSQPQAEADDGESVTPEWLLSCGWRMVDDGHLTYDRVCEVGAVIEFNRSVATDWYLRCHTGNVYSPSRKVVRNLCAALGISLTEQARQGEGRCLR